MGFATIKLEGVVQEDPKLRWTGDGVPCANITLRVVRANGHGRNVSYIPCKKIGEGAEQAVAEIRRGMLLLVEGSLLQERWKSGFGRLFVDAATIELKSICPEEGTRS